MTKYYEKIMEKGKKHTKETKEKISKSLIGNDNAEKWTQETVMPILEEFENILYTDTNYEFITLMDLLMTKRLYPHIWHEWSGKFKENETVFSAVKRIESILENKLVTGALKSKFNPTMSIFTLKNKYSWVDKSSITGGIDENGIDKPLQIIEIRNYESDQKADKGN